MDQLSFLGIFFFLFLLVLLIYAFRGEPLVSRRSATEEAQEKADLMMARVVDEQGIPQGAINEVDGRRRIVIPGFRAALSSFLMQGVLEEPVGVASYDKDDRYFGLQVMGDWLHLLGINPGTLLIFENSPALLPGWLVVYSKEEGGDFKFGMVREEGDQSKIVSFQSDESSFAIEDEPYLFIYGHKIMQVEMPYELPGN